MIYEIVGSKKHKKLIDLLMIISGSFLIACGISIFLVPNRLAAGGVSGIGTIIYHLTDMKVPVGFSMIILKDSNKSYTKADLTLKNNLMSLTPNQGVIDNNTRNLYTLVPFIIDFDS